MGDLMLWITEKLSTDTPASWANMTYFQCCPINLRDFCMSFMIFGSLALIFHPCLLIEAILMYMEQSITIRYGSLCICSLAGGVNIIVIIAIFSIIVIIFIKIIWVKATHIFISALRLHQVYVLGLAVNQDSNGGVDLCSSFLDRN